MTRQSSGRAGLHSKMSARADLCPLMEDMTTVVLSVTRSWLVRSDCWLTENIHVVTGQFTGTHEEMKHENTNPLASISFESVACKESGRAIKNKQKS